MPRLVTAETFYQRPPDADPARPAEWCPASYAGRDPARPLRIPPVDAVAPRTEVEAVARVDHGRWVVDCPWCTSSQIAAETDRRFLCVDCHNGPAGGRWVAVTWPATAPTIERILAVRPTVNAHWQPGESVTVLRRDNTTRGLPAEATADELARMAVPFARAGQPPAPPTAGLVVPTSPDVGPVAWPPSAASAAGLSGMARPGRP